MRTRLSGGVAGVPGAIRGPYAAMGDPSTRGTAVRRPEGVHADYALVDMMLLMAEAALPCELQASRREGP